MDSRPHGRPATVRVRRRVRTCHKEGDSVSLLHCTPPLSADPSRACRAVPSSRAARRRLLILLAVLR